VSIDKSLFQLASQLILSVDRILIVSHVRPDGDSLGSLLGLGSALESIGKKVQMVSEDGVPAKFKYLDGSSRVLTRQHSPYDVLIILDCSGLERIGKTIEEPIRPDINIDHHITNLNFAKINLVDDEAVATAEIIFKFLNVMNLPIPPIVADALLTGLITDTLGFRTNNMTPKALRVVAKLMDKGANLPNLYKLAMVNRSFEAMRFWGAGLLDLKKADGLVWTSLTMLDRENAKYSGRDDADLINILSSINEAKIAVIFVEQPNGKVKVSWRSQPNYDVAKIALMFGGGGHSSASGAEIYGNLSDVKSKVLGATRSILNKENIQSILKNQRDK
jgi:phosphoesterase RecJ-like protein